jgi:uncharacterized coiled-coil protein SlyX
MNPLTQSKNATILPVLIALMLGCFALSPQAQAVCQEGCLTNSNTVLGDDALFTFSIGSANTAIGFNALYSTRYGISNTGVGSNALVSNDNGHFNTAVGSEALANTVCTSNNTAVGYSALAGVPMGCFGGGSDNVAVGYQTMANAHAYSCTAVGSLALFVNTGQLNTALGKEALTANTSGEQNTALGWRSLFNNITGNCNTVSGLQAMFYNTSGSDNVALGPFALGNNVTGNNNIAVGFNAGFNLTTGGNNIDIGSQGVAGEANTIRIGTQGTQTATFIAGVSGAGVIGPAVKVNAAGQIGTAPSSARFKQNIKPMDKASEAIHALKPVTFVYKKEIDSEGIPQFGLLAEDVEKVNPALVARDDQGKPYTVRYEAVNAMLLNEFLKEHRKMEELKSRMAKQEATISQLKSTVAQQQKDLRATAAHQQEQIEALSAVIQKVRTQVEMSNSAPKVVLND